MRFGVADILGAHHQVKIVRQPVVGEDGPGGGGAVGGQGEVATGAQELEKLPQKRFLHHHRDKGAVIKTAGEVKDGRKVRIAVKEVVKRFPPVSYTHLRAHETRHDLV